MGHACFWLTHGESYGLTDQAAVLLSFRYYLNGSDAYRLKLLLEEDSCASSLHVEPQDEARDAAHQLQQLQLGQHPE